MNLQIMSWIQKKKEKEKKEENINLTNEWESPLDSKFYLINLIVKLSSSFFRSSFQ